MLDIFLDRELEQGFVQEDGRIPASRDPGRDSRARISAERAGSLGSRPVGERFSPRCGSLVGYEDCLKRRRTAWQYDDRLSWGGGASPLREPAVYTGTKRFTSSSSARCSACQRS